MFGFQIEKRISESILLWKWPRNTSDIEDNAYKTPIFAYSKKLEFLILVSCITKSDVEEENFPPYPEDAMMDLEEEMTNLKNTTLVATPQSTMGSNKLNDPPMASGHFDSQPFFWP